MDDGELEVVEFVLTAAVYTEDQELAPDDLPAKYRTVFWSDGQIERPLSATVEAARGATGVEGPWETVSGLMFTDYDDVSGAISFTDRGMAEEWYRERVDADRLRENPVLAAHFADEFGEELYEQAHETN
jgi:hypothetical protein